MDLSKLLCMHKKSLKSLSDACLELKTLQRTEGYTTDSSETMDEKNICVLSDRYNNTMKSLENHSALFEIRVVTSPSYLISL
jgi:hypothetical protein